MDNGKSAYERWLDGDETAVGEIIGAYKDGLILYINGFVRNIGAAEELCEDAFVKIFTKKPKIRENVSFKTFLYAVGRNAALDRLRREKKRKSVGLDECAEISDDEINLEKKLSSGRTENRRLQRNIKAEARTAADFAARLFRGFFRERSRADYEKVRSCGGNACLSRTARA